MLNAIHMPLVLYIVSAHDVVIRLSPVWIISCSRIRPCIACTGRPEWRILFGRRSMLKIACIHRVSPSQIGRCNKRQGSQHVYREVVDHLDIIRLGFSEAAAGVLRSEPMLAAVGGAKTSPISELTSSRRLHCPITIPEDILCVCGCEVKMISNHSCAPKVPTEHVISRLGLGAHSRGAAATTATRAKPLQELQGF